MYFCVFVCVCLTDADSLDPHACVTLAAVRRCVLFWSEPIYWKYAAVDGGVEEMCVHVYV